MEHNCKDSDFIVIDQIGDLVKSKCSVCGKVVEQVVCFPTPDGFKMDRKILMLQWSDEVSISKQIFYLRKEFDEIKRMSKVDLLALAQNGGNLKLGEFIQEKCNRLIIEAREYGVILFVQDDNL